jgi:hypothetical protein
MQTPMPTEYHARIVYTGPMLRQAVRTFVRRAVLRRRWWLWLSAVLLAALGLALEP